MPVIGLLSQIARQQRAILGGISQGLNQAGFFEGKNVAIEFQSAEDRYDFMPALAAELVHRQDAVIVAVGGFPPSLAAKAATSIIPIVFIIGGDPVLMSSDFRV